MANDTGEQISRLTKLLERQSWTSLLSAGFAVTVLVILVWWTQSIARDAKRAVEIAENFVTGRELPRNVRLAVGKLTESSVQVELSGGDRVVVMAVGNYHNAQDYPAELQLRASKDSKEDPNWGSQIHQLLNARNSDGRWWGLSLSSVFTAATPGTYEFYLKTVPHSGSKYTDGASLRAGQLLVFRIPVRQ